MTQPETLGKSVRGKLKLVCLNPTCRHFSRWPKRMALAVFGPHATPYSIRLVIKCSVCGSKKCDVGS